MANNAFVAKNGIIANGSFIANSTVVVGNNGTLSTLTVTSNLTMGSTTGNTSTLSTANIVSSGSLQRTDIFEANSSGSFSLSKHTNFGDIVIYKQYPTLLLQKTSNTDSTSMSIRSYANTLNRWIIDLGTNEPETGGDVGTNFALNKFNDAGNYNGTVFSANRNSGNVTFNYAVYLPTAGKNDVSQRAATTEYVINQLANSSQTPVMNGVANVGSSLSMARADHVHPSDTSKVNKSGDTITGDLYLKPTTNVNSILVMDAGNTAMNSRIIGRKAGTDTWLIDIGDDTPSTGNNTGSNFRLGRMNDAGTWIEAALTINRSSGDATFSKALISNDQLRVNSNAPVLGLNRTGNTGASITGMKSGQLRWSITLGNSAGEVGSNSGSYFTVDRYSDTGDYINSPLIIYRSSGVVQLTNDATVLGSLAVGYNVTANLVSTNTVFSTYGVRGHSGSAGEGGALKSYNDGRLLGFTSDGGYEARVVNGVVSGYWMHGGNCRYQDLRDWGGIQSLLVNRNDGTNFIFYSDSISSDRNVKKNIAKSSVNALQCIKNIEMVSYDLNDDGLFIDGKKPENGHVELGVIAQQAVEHIPGMFAKGPVKWKDGTDRDTWKVRYEQAVPYLLQSIKQLLERVEELEAKVNN